MQHIYGLVRKCVDTYKMIEKDDRIAVGVSGGKDSLLVLAALAGLRRFYPKKFSLEAITVDMGFDSVDLKPITDFSLALEVNHTIVPTNIARIVFDVREEKNPCSLCANLRRGALHSEACKMGCNKVALGHHLDDTIETFLLSLLYEGRIACYRPVTYLDRKNITLIRPLLFVEEELIKQKTVSFPVVHNPCPANGHTKRQEAKELIASLNGKESIKKQIFGAIQRLPLPGWNIV